MEYSKEHDTYLKEKYKPVLLEAYNKSNEAFIKELSFISSGAIGATFLFLDSVVKDFATCQDKEYLFASWAFLIFTLLANLFGHNITMHILYNSMSDIDHSRFNTDKHRSHSWWMRLINWVLPVTLVAGIILFLVFSHSNMYKMKADATKPTPNTETGQKSYVPAAPAPPPPSHTPAPAAPPAPAPAPATPSDPTGPGQ